ncbi:MAG: CTP synthase, partial [Desulfobacterales bacterium]|nr:CTP synthase [Desulfobacterales bacterium]
GNMCRTDRYLSQDLKSKIALFCNVSQDAVVTAKDVDCIYEVPLVFHREGLDAKILEVLNIWTGAPRLEAWEKMVQRYKSPQEKVAIAVVGKYTDLTESYKSLNEALYHGGIDNKARVELVFVDSGTLTDENCAEALSGADGVLVPGGFGSRGIEGKISAIRYARQNAVPYFGICLGMQLAVIEFARNVAEITDAHSSEFKPDTTAPVIYLMTEWFDERTQTVQRRDANSEKGGTMRLGAYPCRLEHGSKAFEAYGTENISERHRHRYEFNLDFRGPLEEHGMVFSGFSPRGDLVEIIEIKDHPWFLGCQFHPEFKSRPMSAHPLFSHFIRAALEKK